ncbi:MAG: hypothetical protein R3Y27_00620 [Clostridia bacterium]
MYSPLFILLLFSFCFFCGLGFRYRLYVCLADNFSAVLAFVVLGHFRFIFMFVDAIGAVSAAAGALRFFACPKKVTKKMAFSFFGKKKNKKSIQGSVLENPLALRWLSLGLALIFCLLFFFLFFGFVLSILRLRSGEFSAVLAFVVLGNFPFYIYFC